jgi:lipopolysaccharide export system permease protein
MVDLFERLDDMIKNQAQTSLVLQYCLFSIPMILYQVSPLGVLLATFITLGLFVRHNEITALKAQGISLFRILRVFIYLSICLSLVCLGLQEYVLPYTNMRVKEIKNVHIKGRKTVYVSKKPHLWYRINDAVYNIEFFDPEKNSLQDITILHFVPNVFLKTRIDAQRGVWANNTWVFSNGTTREFSPEGKVTLSTFTEKSIPIHKTPEDFKMSWKKGDEMGLSEIRSFVAKIKREGYPATPYIVDMHTKFSYAFINVIMALLGIPFALQIGRSGGMAIGIAVSIAVGFAYWIFFAFCVSLGKGGTIAPLASAWTANAAFGLLGLYLFLHVRQ